MTETRKKLDPNKYYPWTEYCWMCLSEGYATPASTKTYGFPRCKLHKDMDPEELERIFIQLLGDDRSLILQKSEVTNDR